MPEKPHVRFRIAAKDPPRVPLGDLTNYFTGGRISHR